jgi:AbiTii
VYSLDEVNEALEKDTLKDALYKMKRYAQQQGHTELAQWCSWELDGYPDGYEKLNESEEGEIIKYRSVSMQWKDTYGRTAIIDPKLSFMNSAPIWIGVAELDPFLQSGCSYNAPSVIEMINKHSTVPMHSGWIQPNVIQGLFDKIRLQARSRLHNVAPRIPLEPDYPLTTSPAHVEAASSLFKVMILIVGALAIVITGGGIYAIVKSATSETKIDMFGLSVSTGHVGVAFVSLGVILLILVYKNITSNIYKLSALPDNAPRKKKEKR